MRTSAIRKMEETSLREELTKQYEQLKQTRNDIRLGKEKDTKKSLKIKRNIARMLTVLTEMNFKR